MGRFSKGKLLLPFFQSEKFSLTKLNQKKKRKDSNITKQTNKKKKKIPYHGEVEKSILISD